MTPTGQGSFAALDPTPPSTSGHPDRGDPAGGSRARIIEAALESFARYGVSKTTLEDIAREARCSRATLYRYFPGKQALLEGVVHSEVRRVARDLEPRIHEATSLEDAMVATLHHVGGEFDRHSALQHVLAVEPEVVLPHVVFEGAERLFSIAAVLLSPHFARFLAPDDAVRAGEWLCRLAITYLFSPSEHVSLTDEDSVRRLVRTHVLPGVALETMNSDHLVPTAH